jgi:predicted RNase H-like HicB family nuclease
MITTRSPVCLFQNHFSISSGSAPRGCPINLRRHFAAESGMLEPRCDGTLGCRDEALSHRDEPATLIESDEGFAVSCPALPGCLSQGETREAALANIREATQLWLEVAEEDARRETASEVGTLA